MTPPHYLNVDRKTSNTSSPGLSRANILATPSSRPLTPLSAAPSARHKVRRLTSLFDRHRVREPEFEMLTPPSRAFAPPSPPPTISKLAKAFVDALTARQLSDFLTFMLYYDIVDLPDSPNAWYQSITNMEMRGWVALGDFLSRTSKSTNAGYGFDLVVLDAICDRIGLQRSTVHSLLIQFTGYEKMAYTQVTALVRQCRECSLSTVETFEAVQAKLKELQRLAKRLKPTENSMYETWHAMVIKRIQETLEGVIDPRITNLRSGAPLITAATSEQLPNEVKDSIKLTYTYEAMQPKRQVPLHRYEIYPEVTVTHFLTPPSSPPDGQEGAEAEQIHQHANQLMIENHNLRAQVAELERDKKKLQDSNDKLARRFATFTRIQPRKHGQSQMNDVFTSSPSSNQSLQISQDDIRPRSLSADAGLKLAAHLDDNLNLTSHKHQRSHALSFKYEDVFSALDTPPSPPIRLSDPATGGLLEPTTPPVADRTPSRAVNYAVNAGRRSGIIFKTDQKNLMAAIRGATPEPVEENDDEDGCEGGDEGGTPEPRGLRETV